MTEESIGTARIDVVVNTDTMQPGVTAARGQMAQFGAQAEAEYNRASSSSKRYATSLLNQAEMLGKTRAEQIAYNAQVKVGGELGKQIAEKALAQQAAMNAVTGATTRASHAIHEFSLNNSFARRELGRLVTDIAKGNYGRFEQTSLTLANASGLLGKVFSATGAAIGVTTVALGIFGKEIYDREADLFAFNKALAATGNFAGVTGLELQGIAALVGQQTDDYTKATAAVLALAQSGTVLGNNMQNMAKVAVNMATLTGESVQKVVQDLIALQGDPTQAIAKATGAMGLLTQAQYDQIVETQQQQGATAAAALAMQDLSDASNTARQNLVDNAGTIIRAYEKFKGLLSEIGRDLGSIGAQESLNEQIADQQARIKTINARSPFDFRGDDATKQRDLADANAKIAALQLQQQSDAMFAAGQELGNQAKQAHDKALAEFLHSTKQGDEGFVTQAAEINKKRYEALVGIVDPSVRDKINAAADQQIRDAVKRLDEQYPSNPVHHANPAAVALATFQSQVAGLTDRSLYVEGDKALTTYVQGVAKLNDEFDKAIAKHADLTKAQAAYDDGMKALTADLDKNEAARKAQTQAFTDSLNDQLAARKALIDITLKTMTMGPQEAANYKQLAEVTTEATRAIAEFEKQHVNHPDALSPEAYDAELKAIKNYWSDVYNYTKDGQQKVAALQGDFSAGMKEGIAAFIEETNNQFEHGKQFMQDFASGFADAFSQFASGAESAKKAFGDFIDSLFAEALRFEANQAVAKLLGAIQGTHQQTFSTSSLGTGFNIDSGSSASGGFWSEVGSLIGSFFGGGRANGGPVDAGHIYQVNENNTPELLSIGARTYLMMGKESGKVTPAAEGRTASMRAGAVTVHQTIVVGSLVNRRTQEQLAQETARRQRIATARNG